MNILTENLGNEFMARLMHKWVEIAYAVFGVSGLEFQIDFPSDWHEEQRGWLRVGLGFMRFAVSFPWPWVVPDNHQCSGPQYGFIFFGRSVHVHYGKDKYVIWDMPWAWAHVRHQVLNANGVMVNYISEWSEEPNHEYKDGRYVQTVPYKYILKSGEVQERKASIYVNEMEWQWKWLQWLGYPKKIQRAINIDFDSEVGERSGSWKGGVCGCSYEMLPGETAYKTLMRMEKERKL